MGFFIGEKAVRVWAKIVSILLFFVFLAEIVYGFIEFGFFGSIVAGIVYVVTISLIFYPTYWLAFRKRR